MVMIPVLNARDDVTLARVTLRQSHSILDRGAAVIEEAVEGEFFGDHPKPLSLRLVRHIDVHFVHDASPQCFRDGVLARDSYECAYCGELATTVDHVFPKSKGGSWSWMNLVACCGPCNQFKRNRTPEEAGMTLWTQPYVPVSTEELGLPPRMRGVARRRHRRRSNK